MTDCPFCDYAGPSEILADYGASFVIRPIDPVTEGHVLVVPKRHVTDFTTNIDITGHVFTAAARWCKEYCGCREHEKRPGHQGDANLITSKGAAATQTIDHFHVHVVPRRPGDRLALPWSTSSQQPVPDTGEAIRKQRDKELRERLLSDETRRNVATALAQAKDEGHFTIAQTEAALQQVAESIFAQPDPPGEVLGGDGE